ncbi:MAG: hypothetical protein FJ215_09740 [Ignavibacteria bacterium]|nr:hypothetical protein [Ignavibacteria bacterium]
MAVDPSGRIFAGLYYVIAIKQPNDIFLVNSVPAVEPALEYQGETSKSYSNKRFGSKIGLK